MPFVALTCPSCGAKLNVNSGRIKFCEYCGNPIAATGAIKTELDSINVQQSLDFSIHAGKLISYRGESTHVVIPDTVKTICRGAFGGAYQADVESIEIPDSVAAIESGAFDGIKKSLKSVKLPNGLTSISAGMFQECSQLTTINIPSGVASIGNEAFYGCSSLTTINIPSGVASIGRGAFSACSSLTTINIPSGVASIGKVAFAGCSSLTNINIPSGVTSIGEGAFAGCSSLTAISLPDNPEFTIEYCFKGCTSLTNVTIPDSTRFRGIEDYYADNNHSGIPDGQMIVTHPLKNSKYMRRLFEGTPFYEQLRANWRKNGVCDYCGGQFRGIFKKWCSCCGSEKSYK